jgi:hypothetical protein
MFIGHYAVALAAKKATPGTSLGTLFIAAQFVDLLWPVLLLLGLEHVRIDPGNTMMTPLDFYDYPISHSLLGAVLWSALVGFIYFALRRHKTAAVVVGLCVISHWILDLITHRPDLPLGFGGDTRLGLGLWNSFAGTVVVEAGLFLAGIVIYLKATRGKDRIGTLGFWGLVMVLLGVYIANLFGPPPPEAQAIAVVGNLSWLFVLWAYWVDRHRRSAQIEA